MCRWTNQLHLILSDTSHTETPGAHLHSRLDKSVKTFITNKQGRGPEPGVGGAHSSLVAPGLRRVETVMSDSCEGGGAEGMLDLHNIAFFPAQITDSFANSKHDHRL